MEAYNEGIVPIHYGLFRRQVSRAILCIQKRGFWVAARRVDEISKSHGSRRRIRDRAGALTPGQSDSDSTQNTSNSASGLVSTLVVNLVISGAMVLLFVLLRRREKRTYMPRTYLGTLRQFELTPPSSTGLISWIKDMYRLPDTYVLQHHSMDAYFLLRYLKIVSIICFVGCLVTWPVLFSVNATGGGTKQQLDILSISNVSNTLGRYYAHCFISWIFVGESQLTGENTNRILIKLQHRIHIFHDHSREHLLYQRPPGLRPFASIRKPHLLSDCPVHFCSSGIS